MKKLLMALVLLPLMALADTETVDGITWTYTISNGKASVGTGKWYASAISAETVGAITIPSTLGGLPVTGIGDGAFRSCKKLTSVTIPGGVTNIGEDAFYGCEGLGSVAIPQGVTSIGKYAFEYCRGLTSVVMPASLTSIGNYAFNGCDSIVSVTIPACVTRLSETFPYIKIKEVVICEGVKNICEDAFEDCRELVSVTIPSSVTHIGAFAFYGCAGLMSINVPSGVEYIGDRAFHGCCGLADADGFVIFNGVVHDYFGSATTVIMPSGVTSIGNCAFEGCDVLMSVKIPGSVTNIGFEAFYGCDSLETVTISEGVEEIGYGAFEYCSKLRSVAIPSSVKSIGDDAFYNCYSLESVTISEGVEEIGYGAFEYCSKLKSVMIPSSVTNIGEFAFHGCDGLMMFVVADDNVSYSSLDGVLCNRAKTELIQCPASKQGAVVLPASVASIGQYAFYGCDNVTEVEIPQGVTNIGEYAFYGCRELTSVTIPPSVTSIEDCAFEGCIKLQGVYITDLASWWKVQFAGYSANPLCYAKKLYRNGVEVSEAVVPDGVTNVGDYVFYGCETLSSVTISEGVTNIGDCAFCGCCAISAIMIPQGVVSIGNRAFSGCAGAMSVAIPSSVNVIASESFYGCAKLDSVVIPEGVERIERSAFSGCSKLAAVTIPQSMASSGYDAFAGCTSIRKVTAASLADWMSIDFANIQANPCWCGADLRFNNSYLSSNLILPEGLTRIDEATFAGCENLTSVFIPSSVTYVATSAFSGCKSLSAIRVDPSNLYYASSDGVLYDKDINYLRVCPSGYQGVLTIPASVTSISHDNFGACTRMTSISVSEGNDWFCSKNGLLCSRDGRTVMACPGGMSDLILPDNISDVYYGAFSKCTNLRRVTVPASMTTIPSGVFQDCRSLKELVIQSGVSKVADSAFSGCIGLTAVSIPKSVQSIGRYVFKRCEGLKEISVPFIGSQRGSGERFYSLFGYSSTDVPMTLASVTITDDSSVPNYAFEGCKNIKEIILPIGVSSIGDSAFRGCESLNAISLPAGIAKIGSSAFYGCSSLSEVVIPVGVSSVESSTFYDCTSLRKVTLPVGLTEIGDSAFRNCRNLSQVNIPNTVSSIGLSAFSSCVGLGSGVVIVNDCLLTVNPFDSWSGTSGDVVIPSSVRLYAEGQLFNGVGDLTSIVINAGPKEIPEFFFAGCSNLKSVVINPGVKVIGGGAFSRCVRLESVQLPEGLEAVGIGAFGGCVTMESLAIPSTVSEFGGLPSSFIYIYDDWWGWEFMVDTKSPRFKTVSVAAGNKTFATYNGLLYSKDGKTLYGCPSGLRAVSIRKGTNTIKSDAFMGCSLLETIEIPEGVIPEKVHVVDDWGDIYDYETPIHFTGCSSLKSISVPSTLTAFELPDSPVLSSLKVAAGNPKYLSSGNLLYLKTQFGIPFNTYKVLVGCPRGLGSPVVADDTKYIATAAFEGCALIETLILPASVERIGQRPFVGCKRLKTVEYGGHAPLPYHDQAWERDGWTGSAMSPDINSWDEVRDEEMAEQIREDWGLYAYAVTNIWVEDEDYTQSCGGGYYVEENVLLSVESHVLKGTKGWGDSDEWQGRPLVYVGLAPAALTYYSVEFDPCGGECECVSREVAKSRAVGTLPTPILSRHKFLGWYTAAVGGTKISAMTKVTADVTYYAHWQYDGLALVSAKVVADCAGMGIVSGGKRAKAGTKVTLKATAGKGYAFAGWYLGGELVTKSASYSFKATGEDADYWARFVTLEEDKASIRATVNGMAFSSTSGQETASPLATNALCGVALFWPLSHEALSATSVKVTGLPKGLKYDTKKKAITGTPTAPGKTSSVKVAVTTAGKQKATFVLKVTVDPLPEWARGQFTGEVDGNTLTMTVGSTGKVSGKFKDGITNWTFSASSFATNSVTVGMTNLFCRATAKGTYKNAKKKTVTVSAPIAFELVARPDVSPIAAEGLGDFADGTDNVGIRRLAGARISVGEAGGGTVKMDKSYGQVAANKTVKLTATVKKGYTLLGWYDEVTGELLSQKTSFSLVSDGVTDRFVEARFAKESDLSASDFTLDWDGLTNLTVGVAYSAKLTVSGAAAVKIASVSGLPKGLSWKSGKVSGVPTTAKTNTVSVKVALVTNTKKTWTLKQTLVVEPLPEWAAQTFEGNLGTEDEPVPVTVTIGSSGKVSGKYTLDGAKWTFSSSSLSSAVCDEATGEPSAFTANVTASATISKKKKSQKLVVTVTEEGVDIQAP